MSDGKFGGAPSGRSSDDSGYGFFTGGNKSGASGFGGAPTTGSGGAPVFGGPAPSGFGTIQAGPAGPFGAPAPGAAPAFGAPLAAPGAQVTAGAGRSVRAKVAVALLAVLVLGGGFSGWRYYQHHRAITVPSTLGGLPKSSDTRFTTLLDATKDSVQKANPDFSIDAAVYGNAKGFAFLLVGRGNADIDGELAGLKGQSTTVGANTCVVEPAKTGLGCLRTGGQLTVMVFTSYGTGDVSKASAMVDEAWAAQ